jgi:hypothetical protein
MKEYNMSKEIIQAYLRCLLIAVIVCVAAVALTSCSVVYDSPNDNIEGDNNNDGRNNNQEQNEDNSTAPATAGLGWLLPAVFLSVALGGCINSPTTWSPNMTIGVNSGIQGSGTGVGTDEKTGMKFDPKIEREGGASVETKLPDPNILP